ncbi:MAG: hypothetical protein SFV22_08710 [Saprospiraceae bacterium]|nr:hypothetical protein [Saprospiraceae bacterium]
MKIKNLRQNIFGFCKVDAKVKRSGVKNGKIVEFCIAKFISLIRRFFAPAQYEAEVVSAFLRLCGDRQWM